MPPRETLYNGIACIVSLANTSLPKSRCERCRDIAFAICHASMLYVIGSDGRYLRFDRRTQSAVMPISVHGQLTFGILQVITAQ